jgi:hypothetical protein
MIRRRRALTSVAANGCCEVEVAAFASQAGVFLTIPVKRL